MKPLTLTDLLRWTLRQDETPLPYLERAIPATGTSSDPDGRNTMTAMKLTGPIHLETGHTR